MVSSLAHQRVPEAHQKHKSARRRYVWVLEKWKLNDAQEGWSGIAAPGTE